MNSNWITYTVGPAMEEQAQEVRRKRDAQYPNIFPEEDTDMRWVGDLGELVFIHWLKQRGIRDYQYHFDNAAGKPDFTIRGVQIDVKTVKRKVAPKDNYTAQITAQHANHPIDELFFMSYEFQQKKMWLLGGISMENFLRNAKYYSAGENVHSNYKIRPGHNIYNMEISLLEQPERWLKKLG